MKAILASQNSHKAEEFASALTLMEISPAPVKIDVDENETTFAGNARLKAMAYANATHTNALADDSGLSVDYLNGAPGVYSARFATLGPEPDHDPNRTAANNRKLLRLLKDVPDSERGAHFTCALCLIIVNQDDIHHLLGKNESHSFVHYYDSNDNLVNPQQNPSNIVRAELAVEGHAYGRILHAPAGNGGFGYDPLFFCPEAGCTFAELTQLQKLTVSHRGKAIERMNDILRRIG